MPIELKVPEVGESIKEVQIGQWRKRVGEQAQKDENVVEIESDKATVDLPAPASGTLTKVLKQQGEMAQVGEVIGLMAGVGEDAGIVVPPEAPAKPAAQGTEATVAVKRSGGQTAIGNVESAPTAKPTIATAAPTHSTSAQVMPAAQRVLAEHGASAADVKGTGPGGRVLKEDALRHVQAASAPAPATTARQAPTHPAPSVPSPTSQKGGQLTLPPGANPAARVEEFVTMTPMRRRIAERLVEAQQVAALLTTFNEIDMGEVMELRAKYKESYHERYGIKLGFMSFFVKAAVDALRLYPAVNAEVREPHVVYKNYYDIGIAVGGGKGLVVPILRNAEFMSFAEIEVAVADFGRRAQDSKIKIDELQGGTFTISNGGVYGSLLSTPIVNPPQSGILGLHAIQDRPVARNGQVVIRPMMYVALTYDHRVVDGREAVSFLKRIKEAIEDPSRMLIEA